MTSSEAAERIRVAGYAVLDDVVPLPLIERMREAFDRLLEEKVRSEPSNRGANRFQMYLPFEPPFADPLVYENGRVMEVVEQVLGPDPVCVYFASDTPLPGSDYQRAHSDTQLLFPESGLSLPCYGLVLNIPLVDVTEQNGPLEAWPGGTHFSPGGVDIDAMARELPSVRMTMPAGSVLIRDLRMWHRGTPNRGTRSRPNVALVYTRPWYRFEQQVPSIPRAVFEALSERAKRLLRYSTITG